MMTVFYVAVASAALAGGCSDSGSESDNNQALVDAGVDGQSGSQDATDDTSADIAGEDSGPTSCAVQADCGEATICVDAACVDAPECSGLDDWTTCVDELGEFSPDFARRAACGGTHCRVVCLTDQECGDGQICSDNGRCIEFGGDITGEDPGGDARAPLEAGVSNVLMTFPIGLSQGGYGSRMANNDGRYVESLRATNGQMNGMFARAVVLDNGQRQLMFIRLPVVFPSMAMHEAVARKLQERTGKDWRNSLIITGTHTHSGPTRFWHLPGDAAVKLGTFGTDEFSQQVFDWTVDSVFSAAEAALDDLSPAKFGWDIVEGFDTDDRIASDRWGQTPEFDDNRLLIFRIDDPDGDPRAVMVSFGNHGTIHSKSYFTADAPGGAERGLEKRLGQAYDRFVPVLFLNENGGSMSPRGDHWGHESTERFEQLGDTFARRAMEAIPDIETGTDIALDATTHRFPITYENIGYEPGEWPVGSIGEGSPNDEYDYGGLECTGGEDSDPATHLDLPVTTCLPLHFINHHRPVTLFARSQMTALNVDGLTILTLPGEATMELGWQMLRDARDEFGIDPLDAWVLGYAQDHQFYLTPSNVTGEKPVFPGISTPQRLDAYPDYAFSWRQGGYEAGLSVWGWKFGDFLVDRAMETLAQLRQDGTQSALPAALPTEFSRVDEQPFPIESSDADTVGDIVDPMPESLSRLSAVDFGWVGGDPGAEMPQSPRVVLERKSGESFETVERASHRPYDNREPVMLTRRRKRDDAWQWVIHWEETQDFPTGDYRFRVAGHYQDANGDRQSYETTSRTFTLTPNEALAVTATTADASISGTLGYPAGQPLDFDGAADDRGRVLGNFRMRHPKVGLGHSAPLVVDEDVDASGVSVEVTQNGAAVATWTGDDVAVTTAEETVDGRNGVPVTRFEADGADLDAGTYDVSVEVTDNYQNTGSTTATLVVP